MNDQVASDFHAALMAMQDVEADVGIETEAEVRTTRLAEEVFAFLDACTPDYSEMFEPFEQIAA